jgi:uncharacterized protein YaaQ
MKMILAIVNNDDSAAVSSELTKAGFSVTKLATTGGFLLAGNTTFLIGIEDEKVDEVIDIIHKKSRQRMEIKASANPFGAGLYTSYPIEVPVGGSAIFVLNVERFEKV